MTLIRFFAMPLAALIAAIAFRSRYEKKHFVTDKFEIESDKLPEGKVFRYVFLSDLHDNVYGSDNDPLVYKIRELAPDAVFIGGDMMVCKGKSDLTATVSLLNKLTSFVPVYYANGNHEDRMERERHIYGDLYDKFEEELAKLGVHHINDRSEDINSWIRVTGCGLREKYYKHHFTVPRLPVEEIFARDSTFTPFWRKASPPPWKPFSIAQVQPASVAPDCFTISISPSSALPLARKSSTIITQSSAERYSLGTTTLYSVLCV